MIYLKDNFYCNQIPNLFPLITEVKIDLVQKTCFVKSELCEIKYNTIVNLGIDLNDSIITISASNPDEPIVTYSFDLINQTYELQCEKE